MRYIDLSDNRIPAKAVNDLFTGLGLNKNIIHFDIRKNPCHSDILQAKLAIRLVKNIEIMKKRSEILKKKWINTELLKVHIPANLYSIIQKKYKVDVNDYSVEAKVNIIGKPIFDNFKSYSSKTKKKKKVNQNESFSNYGPKSESKITPFKERHSGDKNSTIRTQSTRNFKFAGVESSLKTPLKGKKTAKSKRNRQFLDESNSSYLINSTVKYLSPRKKSTKRSEKGLDYVNVTRLIDNQNSLER